MLGYLSNGVVRLPVDAEAETGSLQRERRLVAVRERRHDG